MITTMEELARQDKETKKEAIKIERRLSELPQTVRVCGFC